MELVYRQVNCQKSVSGDNFDKGVQDYNFSIGGANAWIPSRSYFRIGMTLLGSNDAPPLYDEQVAFADSVCGNLFNNVYFKAGGQDVSSVVNYMPQIQALKNRLGKSGSWLRSVGKDAFLLESDFQSRVRKVSRDDIVDINSDTVNLGTVGHENDYKVEFNDDGSVVGTNTRFQEAKVEVGDSLIAKGQIYVVATVVDDSNLTVQQGPTITTEYDNASVFKLSSKSDGNGRHKVYGIWQPPLGIFNESDPMGSGDYRISLNPNSYYKTSGVESKRSGLSAPTDFNLTIDSIELYIATVKASTPSTGIETLHLKEMAAQSKTLTNTNGENMLDFQVPPSTYAISVFVQSGDSSNNTKIPPSMFKTKDNSDLKIRSLQLSYANTVKPSTRWTSEYKEDTNKLVQRYHDTLIESGLMFSTGGTETFADFSKRGCIYHYSFVRDKTDPSTHLSVSIDFDGIEQGANLFVVSHYTKTCEITVSNGFISEVITSNV